MQDDTSTEVAGFADNLYLVGHFLGDRGQFKCIYTLYHGGNWRLWSLT